MELTNDFQVAVPVDRAWTVLTDVERIAPCMPGAELQEIEGEEYRGVVKVKVGPITAQYKGAARFLERDDAAHRAVLRAEGRDTRGQGNAAATITATLTPSDDGGTAVTVVTDLTVTGRVAQFGRGVLADVSAKLLDQFVSCLETNVLADRPPVTDEPPPAPVPEVAERTATPDAAASDVPSGDGAGRARRVDSPPAEPVDLLGTAGAPVAKRVGPIVAAVALLWLLWVFLRRRRRK